ncbi:MAG: 2-aminoethylphosphonate aminotransferase [Nitrospinaceae bacterium]|nr:MAG: 2-aminoethylphosphonate aminotransferase [Nitrospinaceae bacterium]
MKRTVLLNPGPVNVSEKVARAQLRGDLCHREEEFALLAQAIRRKLAGVFGVGNEFTPVLISGSGTAALEMAVCSFVSPERKLLVISNGVYGERIARIAEVHGIPRTVMETPWGTPPDLAAVEQALAADPSIEAMALVHHETTTGLLNPLAEASALARRAGKKVLVDAISSLAGDTFDFDTVDLAVGTANKCVQGLPGVSFALVRKDDLPRLEAIPARSLYFNLAAHHRAQESGQTLFTPAVQAHYAFDAALDELAEETVARRIERTRAAALRLRNGFAEMGLSALLPEEWQSNVLTALKLPDGLAYPKLHDRLKAAGFVIYAGQGNLKSHAFRIANIGDIQPAEFDTFLQALGETLAEHSSRSGGRP